MKSATGNIELVHMHRPGGNGLKVMTEEKRR